MSEEKNPIVVALEQTEQRFTEIAPAHMKYDAEKGFAIQVLRNNGYMMKVAREHPQSLQQAVTNVAAIGLSLNPAEKLAYLITRNVKVGDKKWQTRIFLEISYAGLIRLATDSGSIKWVQAACVYKNDEFVDNGVGEKPTHKYDPFASSEDRGPFVGCYSVAKTNDGDYLTTIMPAEEVHNIRSRSEAFKAFTEKQKGNGGPWVTDFSEMAKKAVIRRAFKTWPRTDERRMTRMAEAVELSNNNEGFEAILTSPNVTQYTADQKAYFDQLLESSDARGMYVFSKSVDQGLFTNLYHSFEKGTKGKYQRLVDELLKSGQQSMDGLADLVNESVQRGDELGAAEVLDELTPDELSVLQELLTEDSVAFVAEREAKAA